MRDRRLLQILALILLLAVMGCGGGGATLVAYLGGGLPPGEGDLGGQVVVAASAPALVAPAAEPVPVVGAQVILRRGNSTKTVGETKTGPDGYFKFEQPPTGNYRIVVNPPPDSHLKGAEKDVTHTKGKKTLVTITLAPE